MSVVSRIRQGLCALDGVMLGAVFVFLRNVPCIPLLSHYKLILIEEILNFYHCFFLRLAKVKLLGCLERLLPR